MSSSSRSSGYGFRCRRLSRECFPIGLPSKEIALTNVLCHRCSQGWASLLSLTFPSMLATLKPVGSFIIYAGKSRLFVLPDLLASPTHPLMRS